MIFVVLKRELRTFFRSPMAYVLSGLFALIVGWMFFNQLVHFAENIQKIPVSMRHQYDFANEVIIKLFGNINFLLVFITPILAMKSFAEEYKEKTIDLYFSNPISDYELILGKYFALLIQGLFLLSMTLIFPVIMANIELSDYSFIYTGYLGIFLNFCCFSILGLLASSLGQNQIIAALSGFVFILFTWMIAWFSQLTSNYIVSEILKFLSINHHFEHFIKGMFSFSDISFYLSFIMVVLLFIRKRLDVRNWL